MTPTIIAATAWLVLTYGHSGQTWYYRTFHFQDMKACQESLKAARIEAPHGNENEAIVVGVCVEGNDAGPYYPPAQPEKKP